MATAKKIAKRKRLDQRRGYRRLLSAEAEAFVAMDDKAAAEGMTWNQWALGILLAKIDYRRKVEKARAPR